jgi:hypothetical protein
VIYFEAREDERQRRSTHIRHRRVVLLAESGYAGEPITCVYMALIARITRAAMLEAARGR